MPLPSDKRAGRRRLSLDSGTVLLLAGEGADELATRIDHMAPLQQADLVALSWLGAGVYCPDEWMEARFEARAAQDHRTASYLAGLPELGPRLKRAIQLLGVAPPVLH